EKNKIKHQTDCYDNEDLVVRRGFGFQIDVKFNRKINHVDTVVVQIQTGRRPMESKGSIVNFKIPKSGKLKVETELYTWCMDNVKWSDKAVSFELQPIDVIIGTYQMYIETRIEDLDEVSRFHIEDEDIHIIFNPWWPDDEVYMPNSTERDEYVSNEMGRIWVGSSNSHRGRPWNFGQFDKPCLEAALFLLDRAELKEGARRSVISIVRTISAQANSCDDYGVLEGRWSSEYPSNCTKPWAWSGSVSILEEFMKTGKPVKYGQCWVFSGVVTTLLRALGIPTRSVTNFDSAHDTDCSTTIDSHVDEDGKPLDDLDDSVWNFHVWNESWFRRRDLPDGYDGWQAHDATPQEVSDSVMRCGPAPLKAIREGHVYLNYDVPFIFSEVNGDRIYWKVKEDKSMEVCNVDSHSIGKCISTKAIGKPDRHDITHLYKHNEGRAEERRVVSFVHKFGSRKDLDIYIRKFNKDIKMDLKIPETLLGNTLEISVKMKNTSNVSRTIDGRISVCSCFYTGIPAKKIKSEKAYHVIKPKSECIVKFEISSSDYGSKLNPIASMIVYCALQAQETKQHLVKKASFNLTMPNLKIQVPSQMKMREKSEVTVSFKNPLHINLTNSVFTFECAGCYVTTRDKKRSVIFI
ncbi:hypothetical protein LOTGIDRAFT_120391, partial [Lottia gigantea]